MNDKIKHIASKLEDTRIRIWSILTDNDAFALKTKYHMENRNRSGSPWIIFLKTAKN